MKTISFYANKGGVGKTTLATHLVYLAEERRIRTLAVAMDRQGDLPKWLSKGDQGHMDGSVFDFGKHVTVLYSPDAFPKNLRGAELVIVDCPPTVQVPSLVTPDIWVTPCDGRMALEDLGNVIGSMRATGAEVMLVFNRAEAGGLRTLQAMQRACQRVPGITVWPEIIPDSGAVRRTGEYYLPVWEVPYGADTQGSKAIRSFGEVLLDKVTARAPRTVSRRAAARV
jgi:cellulose biosynthesis protein BcsQ